MANEAVRFLRGTWTNYWKTAPTQDASTKKYNYSQAATNYKDCIYFCITGGSTLTADIKNAGVILLNCAPYTLNEDELKTYIETVKLNVNNGLSKITETSGEGIKFTPLLFADQDKDASANIITKNDIITNILYTGGKNIYANVNNAALYLQSLNAYTSIYAGNTITIGGLGNTISATATGAEYKYYRKMSASSTIDKGIVYNIDNLKIYSELHESNGKTAYINLNNNSDITLSSGKSIKNIAPNILFNFGTSYSSAPNYVDLRPNNDISVYTQRTLGISSYDSSISVSHNLVANISTATIGTTNMAVNTSKGSVAFNDYTGTSISGTQLTLSSTKTAANNTTNNPNVVLKLKNNKTTGINFNDDFVMTYDHDTSSMVLHHGNDIFTKIKKESVNNAWYNSILPNGNVRIGSNSNYFNDGAFLELHSARSISTRWDAYDSNEFVTKSAVESVLPTLGSMRHKGIITIDTYATKLSGKHFVGDSYIVSGDIDAIGGKNGDIIVANDAALENSSSANEFTDSTYVAAHWNLIRLVNSDVIMHDGDNKNETWTSGTVPIVTGTDKINKSPLITDSSYSVLQSVSGSSTYVISGKSGSSSISTLFNNTGNAQDIHDKLIPTLGILDYYKNQIVIDATSAYMQFPKYVLNNYTSGNPTNYLTANRNTMGYIYEAPNTGNSGAAPNTAVHYGNTQSTKNVSLNKARIFAIAGKSGANDSSYMSGIINTDNKWFVTTSLHDYRDSYEVGTTNNIYITSASDTYYKNLTVFDNSVSIPNYDITNNSLSGVEKIIINGNATSNEFISYRSGGQKLYLPNPSNIDKNITNTFVISQDISTMATRTWVSENFNKYVLPVAGTAIGGVKSGTDITVDANGNVSVNNAAKLDGYAASVYAKRQNYNNLIVNSNEFIFVPSGQSGQIYFNYRTASAAKDGSITGYVFCDGAGNNLAVIGNGTFSGNAASATKLATARTINGTSFDGTANISTANWGTARNISIADSDSTNTGSAVSVNGSAAVTLKLPATIKATLNGNAATATTATTATKLTSDAGSSVNPIYFSGGKPAACSYQFGNNSGNAAVSNGTLCTNLNADKLDGYDGSYYATKTDISTMATQKWVTDKGYITANGGSIGGWTIEEDRLFSNDAHASIRMDLSGNIDREIRLGGTEINSRDAMLWIRNDAGTCAEFSTHGNNNSKALSLIANGGFNTFALESRGNVKFGLRPAEKFTFEDPNGDGRKSNNTGKVDFRVPITFNGMSTCYYYTDVYLPNKPSNGMFVFCKECKVFPTNGHPIMEPAGTSVITPVGGWYGTNDRSTFFVYSEQAGQWIAFYCG